MTSSISNLARALTGQGHDVSILSLDDGAGEPRAEDGSRRFPVAWPRDPLSRRIGRSSAMRRYLQRETFDIVHAHGLWMMPNIYPAQALRGKSTPMIVSTHGMLGRQSLQFSAQKKRLLWLLMQRRAVHAAACIHVTSEAELVDVRRAGLTQPVAIIPHGVSLFPVEPRDDVAGGPFLLSLSRIHPMKGLDTLVRGWGLVAAEFPHWTLKIAGPSQGRYGDALRGLIDALGVPRCEILPAAFGGERDRLMRQADLFVLPTRHENFGMTVVESMALGTPVLTTNGTPWQGLADNGCGWCVDYGAPALAEAMRIALRLPAGELAAMGARGREWVARDFQVDRIGRNMADVYDWLSSRGDRPDCIVTD